MKVETKNSNTQPPKKVYKSPVKVEHGKVIDKTQAGAAGNNLFDTGCS